MSQHVAPKFPSFGRALRRRAIDARAGVPVELRAADFLDELPPEEFVTWRVDGHQATGAALKWTFNRPGRFRVRLETSRGRGDAIAVNVGLRLRDLGERPGELDFFYCLIAAARGRWTVLPLLRGRKDAPWNVERAAVEAAQGQPEFAAWLERHGQSYRRHYGVLDVVRREPLASGLYAVFPGSTVYVGTNRALGRAATELRDLGRHPKGSPFDTAALEKALGEFSIDALKPGDVLVGPAAAGAFGGTVLSSLLNELTRSSLDFVEALGGSRSALGSTLGNVITVDGGRGSIESGLMGFGGLAFTRHAEGSLGHLRRDGSLFDFGTGSDAVPPRVGMRGAAQEEADGGSSWPTSGWEKATTSSGGGFVPYNGDPKADGATGYFRHSNDDGSTTLYGKGTSSDGGTDSADGGTGSADGGTGATSGGTPAPTPGGGASGAMGGTTPPMTDDGPLKYEDEGESDVRDHVQGQNAGDGTTTDGGTTTGGTTTDGGTDGGTDTMPANIDNGSGPPTKEEVRWVVFVRGGGLYTYPNPDAGSDGTGESSETVVPGGGYTDPGPQQFFYEWRATPDENRMGPTDPRVTDPGPGDESGGAGAVAGSSYESFPRTGGARLGVMGGPGGLSKTSTSHQQVLVEAFNGADALGRGGGGVFGGVSILRL